MHVPLCPWTWCHNHTKLFPGQHMHPPTSKPLQLGSTCQGHPPLPLPTCIPSCSIISPMLSLLLQVSVQASLSWEDFFDPWDKIKSPCYSYGLFITISAPSQCLSWWPFCVYLSDYLIYSLSHPLDHEFLMAKIMLILFINVRGTE